MELAVINAVPFLLAILLATPFTRKYLSQSKQSYLSSIVMGILFICFVGYFPLLHEDQRIIQSLQWMPSLGISLSFYLDGLSLLFALIITGIGTLIFFYAGYYFDEADEHNRFIVWLMGFAGAMLAVVLSGNLLMMFIAWELTSITSFMLIGFKGDKDKEAREGAFQALFVTGGGALAMIVGILILGVAAGQILYPNADGIRVVTDIADLIKAKGLAQHAWYPFFTVLLMIGAFTKSAQFPFHFWLPGAMSAPTPASAYLHSATMVKAGIYLLARLSPMLYENELWSTALLTIGLSTMFVGALFAIKQRDLKGMLAYSTISKLGAIVAMIGLPGQNGLKAAFIGILAHALYKAALFLVAGTIDHATGTRIIDKLGGLRKYMPVLNIVTIISALSMAGVPFFFGFVAKETLLDGMLHYPESNTTLIMAIVWISSVFTAVVAYLLIADVFYGEEREEIHFHKPPTLILVAPLTLALGSLTFGFLLEPLIIPLLELAVPKEFHLELFAGFNEIFFLSASILGAGFLLFLARNRLIQLLQFPLVSGNRIYREIIAYFEWLGDSLLDLQSGYIRYYLVIILGVVSGVLVLSGVLRTVTAGESIFPDSLVVTTIEAAKILLLILTVVAALITVFVREHLHAALALGIIGYAIGTIFLIEPAPDVALVQLLVETLGTVLVIIMLGRISEKIRAKAMQDLWKGHHRNNIGLLRDLTISVIVGVSVFIFALIALDNRSERESIATWYLENTRKLAHVDDVVGAIVADFRGSDTILEIAVFATAGLGVLTLLARGRNVTGDNLVPDPNNIKQFRELDHDSNVEIRDATNLATPFTRSVSYFVLPVAILIAIAQILYGSSGPGDGFTAGVTIGLAVALWYVVLGYDEARSKLRWFRPSSMVRTGLLLAIVNAIIPMFLGNAFLQGTDYDKLLGIYPIISPLGLHLNTGIVFEIAIAITVMGGVGIIMEAIAHPKEVETLDTD